MSSDMRLNIVWRPDWRKIGTIALWVATAVTIILAQEHVWKLGYRAGEADQRAQYERVQAAMDEMDICAWVNAVKGECRGYPPLTIYLEGSR